MAESAAFPGKLSVFTDELSSDADTALELATSLRFDAVDLRGINEGRYPRVSPLMLDRIPELIREYGLPVVTISPGLFKIAYPEPAPPQSRALRWDDALAFDDEKADRATLGFHVEELLPQSINAAQAVGATAINCFSFDRGHHPATTSVPEAVVKAIRDAAEVVARHGLALWIENEASCWASTAGTAAALLSRINHDNVGLTWDPANAYVAGDDRPFPDGYGLVRRFVRHVHFKDARTERDGSRAFTFDGVLDWEGQLQALGRDGYRGFITIETHQRPKIETTRRYAERVRTLITNIRRRAGEPVEVA